VIYFVLTKNGLNPSFINIIENMAVLLNAFIFYLLYVFLFNNRLLSCLFTLMKSKEHTVATTAVGLLNNLALAKKCVLFLFTHTHTHTNTHTHTHTHTHIL